MASSPQATASSASSTLSPLREDLVSQEESSVRRGRVSGGRGGRALEIAALSSAGGVCHSAALGQVVAALKDNPRRNTFLLLARLLPAAAPALLGHGHGQVQRPAKFALTAGCGGGAGCSTRGSGARRRPHCPAAGYAAPAATPPAQRCLKFQPSLPPPHSAVPVSPISFLPARPLAAAMTARSPRSACAGRARAGPRRGAGAAGCARPVVVLEKGETKRPNANSGPSAGRSAFADTLRRKNAAVREKRLFGWPSSGSCHRQNDPGESGEKPVKAAPVVSVSQSRCHSRSPALKKSPQRGGTAKTRCSEAPAEPRRGWQNLHVQQG
ncbi:uncharacterized protein LOC119700917 [Motacilla alba alba]|uniref:uncharacterized protein LOC119700917 n=1 Tax=Motacilla alba alba TaxID=1094192 RepID=UPI0018D4EBAF|nr:uncharacterized protein LOC119700917 [Motacilla alba alba]